MMLRIVLAALLVLPVNASGQSEEDPVSDGRDVLRVSFRVSSTGPGASVMIDRGRGDGLEVGDSVVFYPRVVEVVDSAASDGMEPGQRVLLYPNGDRNVFGTVREVDDQAARIELEETAVVPAPGTRGEAVVPSDRPVQPRPENSEGSEHPPWTDTDEGYVSDMPLLAQVKPIRPEDRAVRVTGRLTLSGDLNWTSEDGRSDALFRGGVDIFYENPFGRGGGIRFDGEFNYRAIDDPDERDEHDPGIRLDRLSYYNGGTRFSETRWEAGRFLHSQMPEFGVLDGFEWTKRAEKGDRFGASIGFLPEPDADFETAKDFQFAVFYEWVANNDEELAIGGGIQKTWHNGKRDRDLIVTRVRYLPSQGWDLQGTVWIDIYGSSDDAKDSSLEITQAYISSGRRWENGNGLDLTLRRIRFPEILRNGEFAAPISEELADNRYDRLSANGWAWLARTMKCYAELGVWNDEDESGGDGEFGVRLNQFVVENASIDVSVFGTEGQFGSVLGGRLSYGRALKSGRWDLSYEIANHRQDGFSSNRDDILQHRLLASWDLFRFWGCTLSFYGQGSLWDDDEGAFSAGFFLQRAIQ